MTSAALDRRSDETVDAAKAPGLLGSALASLSRNGRTFGIAALIVILGFLSVYPMGMLFYGSLHSTPPGMAGEFNLDGYTALLSAENLAVMANTVGLSLAKTVLSLALTGLYVANYIYGWITPDTLMGLA